MTTFRIVVVFKAVVLTEVTLEGDRNRPAGQQKLRRAFRQWLHYLKEHDVTTEFPTFKQNLLQDYVCYTKKTKRLCDVGQQMYQVVYM